MIYPPLPEPIIVDGRRLYTAGQMRQYAALVAGCDSAEAKQPPTIEKPKYSKVVDELSEIFGFKK